MEKSAGVWKPRVRFPCCWTISKAAISSKFFSSLNVSMMRLINSKMHVFYMNINISTGKVNSSFEYFLIFDPIIVSYLRIRRNESNGIDVLFRERLVGTAYIRNLLFLSIIGYNWTSYQSTKRSKFISRLSENLVYSLCNLLTFATDKILYVTYALDAINRANWND